MYKCAIIGASALYHTVIDLPVEPEPELVTHLRRQL